jgi:hypothetical protein
MEKSFTLIRKERSDLKESNKLQKDLDLMERKPLKT